MPRITFCAIEPRITHGVYNPFSQGIRQLRASIEHTPDLSDWEVRFLDSESKDVDEWVTKLLAERADVIGFSCFVWSFATFVSVAERMRQAQPNVRLLFGGPAARTVMFKMPAFRGRERALDAMVAGEGEWSIVSLLQQKTWDLKAVTAIPGLVFSAAMNGHLRAYAAGTGAIVWDFDTAGQTYAPVGGGPMVRGGFIDAGGPVVAHGLVFQHTGYGATNGGSNVLLAFSIDGR